MSMEQGPESPFDRRISRASVFRWSQELQRQNRFMIGLLVWIATVMTVLLISLVAVFIWASNRYDAWRTSQGEPMAERVVQDFLTRQERFSTELNQVAREFASRQGTLDQRRAALGPIPDDPYQTAIYAVRISQLALDEMIAINRNAVSLQQIFARNLSLFPSEHTLLRSLRNPQAP